MKVLVTGGAGFFGGILLSALHTRGIVADSIDILPAPPAPAQFREHYQTDITDSAAVDALIKNGNYDAIFHLATQLAHEKTSNADLWRVNVEGTRNLVQAAEQHGIGHFSFVSSNCVFGRSYAHAVKEDEPPTPVELYGKSKLAGEEIVMQSQLPSAAAFRTPTIMDEGRMGLLALLFEFVRENRKVWLIGGGGNRYQFVYAKDLAAAMMAATTIGGREVFNVGSDNVPTMAECFQSLINHAHSRSRLVKVPRLPSVLALRLLHWLRLSPLGPYHYRMIASDFVFDTGKAKQKLGWQPTVTNNDALARAYDYWLTADESAAASPHQRAAKMGALRLLKWLS